MSDIKVSFCTGCMNRLEHLKQTFMKNVIQHLNYLGSVEFVLLNYNSDDELDQWARNNLRSMIDSGIVSYYHTLEPEYWDMSHSKNVSHRLGKGQVLCNLDADNFVGEGFYDCIIEKVYYDKTKFIRKRGNGKGGRVALHREHFYAVGGYDEKFCLGWGHEDMDLNSRLERYGLSRVKPVDFDIIHHSKKLRTKYAREKNMWDSRDIHKEILIDNDNEGLIVANKGKVFGKAIVFKNFDYESPIILDENYESTDR